MIGSQTRWIDFVQRKRRRVAPWLHVLQDLGNVIPPRVIQCRVSDNERTDETGLATAAAPG